MKTIKLFKSTDSETPSTTPSTDSPNSPQPAKPESHRKKRMTHISDELVEYYRILLKEHNAYIHKNAVKDYRIL